MKNAEYKELAKYYDIIYSDKDYNKETQFLISIFKKHNVKSVLDVGCGTGNHLAILEKNGFECVGLDLNQEMLDIAKQKVKSKLIKGDMRDFSINRRFDAIICMYATFNHNLNLEDANKTINCFKKHLNSSGLVILDLHNPQSDGIRIDKKRDIEREIKWKFDRTSKTETTEILFKIGERNIKDGHILKIFDFKELKNFFDKNGFSKVSFSENYSFKKATNQSKNIDILGFI